MSTLKELRAELKAERLRLKKEQAEKVAAYKEANPKEKRVKGGIRKKVAQAIAKMALDYGWDYALVQLAAEIPSFPETFDLKKAKEAVERAAAVPTVTAKPEGSKPPTVNKRPKGPKPTDAAAVAAIP